MDFTSQALTDFLNGGNGQASNAPGIADFGVFLKDYVVEGASVQINTPRARQILLNDGIIALAGTLYAVPSRAVELRGYAQVFFIDFTAANGYVVNTVHPVEVYLALWQIETDESGLIVTATDMRGDIGAVRFKDDVIGIVTESILVDSQRLLDDAVGTLKLQDYAVTSMKLATGAVTETTIGDDEVSHDKIKGRIGEQKLQLDYSSAELAQRLAQLEQQPGSQYSEILAARAGYPSLNDRIAAITATFSAPEYRTTAAPGQTKFNISSVGSFVPNAGRILAFTIGRVPQEHYTETSSTELVIDDPCDGGEPVFIKFFQGDTLPMTSGHGRAHRAGGGDELTLSDLKGAELLEKNRVEFFDLAYKGIVVFSYVGTGYSSPGTTFADVANAGANIVSICPVREMDTGTSNAITSVIISNAAVTSAVVAAKAAGLKVALKIHTQCHDGTSISSIAPTNWDMWFASFTNYALEIAAIAQANNVEILFLGTEMQTATAGAFRSKWETLVASVRSVYSGKISYSALSSDFTYGIDERGTCCLWNTDYGAPLVDIAGINLYAPTLAKAQPTVQEIIDAFTKTKDGKNVIRVLDTWQKSHGLPVVLAETGCSNIYGAAASPGKPPWEYPGYPNLPTDNEGQRRFIEALLYVMSTSFSWLQGVFLWKWNTDGDPATTSNFNINGRPALNTIKTAFSRKRTQVIDNTVMTQKTESLPIDVKIGVQRLSQWLNEGTAFKTIRGTDTTDFFWAKVGQVELKSQWENAESVVSLLNGDNVSPLTIHSLMALVFVRVKQALSMGSAPNIDMRMMPISEGASAAEFVAVITQNTISNTRIEFFARHKFEWDSISVEKLHNDSFRNDRIDWRPYGPLIENLPSGTQVAAKYPEGKFNTLQVGGYDVQTKNSFATSTYVRYSMSSIVLAAGVSTRLPYNILGADQRGDWSATTLEFTAPEPGLYLVTATLRCDAQTSGSNTQIVVYVSRAGVISTPEVQEFKSSNAGVVSLQIASNIRLFNVGDKVWIEGSNSAGATTSLNGTNLTIVRGQ